LHRQTAEFSGASLTMTLQLSNPSCLKAEMFCLQRFPSEFFFAVPAYGVVRLHSSVQVRVHFRPRDRCRSMAGGPAGGPGQATCSARGQQRWLAA
jgi:hypothetical protein